MVHQWVFFGSISAIRKIWSLTANSRSLQAAALKLPVDFKRITRSPSQLSWISTDVSGIGHKIQSGLLAKTDYVLDNIGNAKRTDQVCMSCQFK